MPDEPIDKDPESGPTEGVSRRRMLKRIGLVTAVAWTTPVVTSLRTPAFADGISPGGCPCGTVCGDTPGCPLSDCGCLTSVEGKEFCAQDAFCADLQECRTTEDCLSGWACVAPPCPGGCGLVCAAPCGTCGSAAPHAGTPIKGGAKTLLG